MEKDRREIYQLKWSDSNKGGGSPKGLEIFQKIYGKNNHQEMLIQLRNARSKLEKKYSSALLYCALTGLRPAEACLSMQLLKERKDDYLTKDNMILEHFRFPEVFMRRTKNAYISIMFKELLRVIEYSNFVSYNSLRLALRIKN